MVKRSLIFGIIVALTVASGLISGKTVTGAEEMQHHTSRLSGNFQQIEQPLWLKGAVTAGGLGLIGLELWWFLGKKLRG